jgi:hypothetical protein
MLLKIFDEGWPSIRDSNLVSIKFRWGGLKHFSVTALDLVGGLSLPDLEPTTVPARREKYKRIKC